MKKEGRSRQYQFHHSSLWPSPWRSLEDVATKDLNSSHDNYGVPTTFTAEDPVVFLGTDIHRSSEICSTDLDSFHHWGNQQCPITSKTQFQKKRKGEPFEKDGDLKDTIAMFKRRTCLNPHLKRPAMRSRSRENQRNVNLGCVVNESKQFLLIIIGPIVAWWLTGKWWKEGTNRC